MWGLLYAGCWGHLARRLEDTLSCSKGNAICDRFSSSVRRECLDHILVLGELHLYRVIREYVAYFNRARLDQGIEQRIPDRVASVPDVHGKGTIIAFPTLNGLHHDYRRAA